MKKRTSLLLSIIFLGSVCPLHAQPVKGITLKDGSKLQGKVLQLSEGIYTIETPNLGKINIPESDILSIESKDASAEPSSPALKEKVAEVQNSIMSDPNVMDDIQKLTQDKEIMGILSDPDFVKDAMSMDQEKLEQNQKTQDLLENPKIRSLINKINQKLSAEE